MINIIIPAWNCEKYVGQCLDSLFLQTYQDFRIIAVNDGSTDKTLDILNAYRKKHKNLVVISQKNQGPATARNTGIDYLLKNSENDDYLIFIDADDWVEPEFLQTLFDLMGENVGLATCGYKWQKQTTKHFKNKHHKILTFDKENTLNQLFVDKYFYGTLWNKLLRCDYAKGLRFNSDLWQSEDTLYISQYILNLPKNAISKHSTKLLYHYQRTKGLSSMGFNPRKLKVLDTFQIMRENIIKSGLENCITYLNSWEFLILIELIFYMRGRKTREEHTQLKQTARTLLKDYKAVKNQYRPFRRYANLIFWCL